jgi:UDP-glucuronate decarboxylase
MKSILVTGGAGFLGSHLCERLLAEGDKVICVDDFSTGSEQNILHLSSNQYFELIDHDITLPLIKEVDQIYNLACPASPVHYQSDPIKTTKTNIFGALNMLDLAKNQGINILQASTSEVYGDPEIHPQIESYWGNVNSTGPRSCYDEGKRCAESLFFDYHREYGINVKVVRIFNTYGSRMHIHDGRVVSNFIVQAILGNDLTIYGDGLQTRSFCFVDDMIDGFIRMMNSNNNITGPINLGNPGEFTMLELAEKILKLTNSKSKIIFLPLPEDDPTKRKPSITLAKKSLNWSPKVDINEGLIATVNYFNEVISNQ